MFCHAPHGWKWGQAKMGTVFSVTAKYPAVWCSNIGF